MHILNNDTMSHCDSLFDIGYGYEQESLWQQSYDTLQLFMEQCPYYVGTNYNDGVTGVDAFRYIDADATQIGKLIYPNFLTWLKSVLYLNPDITSGWYCQDVTDMVTALQGNTPALLAMMCYVTTSGKCPSVAYPEFDSTCNQAATLLHHYWLDSLYNVYGNPFNNIGAADSIKADTLAHPYNDAIPTLQQVGLQILLGPQYADVGTPAAATAQALISAQLIENPTTQDEIGVSFQMGRSALVTMQLRDVLGRLIPILERAIFIAKPRHTRSHHPRAQFTFGNVLSPHYYGRWGCDHVESGEGITTPHPTSPPAGGEE